MDIGNEMRVIDVEETVVDPERIEVREPAETSPPDGQLPQADLKVGDY